MPRGVYDRSKLKKKAAKTETQAVEAPKAKRKYTRRAAAPNPELGVAQAPSISGELFYQLRELASLRAAGIVQVDSLIKKLVTKLEAAWDEANSPVEKVAEVKAEKKNGKTIEKAVEEKLQTALPAPVPFIPQAPSNPA